MVKHLILVLEGPLAAYGAEMVDARGPVRDWPGASLLAGLLANALGFDRAMGAEHAALQARLDFAVRIDRAGERLLDQQNAQLFQNDSGWTTRGQPEGRAPSPSYANDRLGRKQLINRRLRDYFADSAVTVALSLRDADAAPSLEAIAAALETPARPLFLGRKPCLPTRPLFAGFIDAEDVLAAVCAAPRSEDGDADPWIVVRDRPGLPAAFEPLHVTDERNWRAGVHAGERLFRRGRASRLGAASEGRPT